MIDELNKALGNAIRQHEQAVKNALWEALSRLEIEATVDNKAQVTRQSDGLPGLDAKYWLNFGTTQQICLVQVKGNYDCRSIRSEPVMSYTITILPDHKTATP